jgi:RimJ/RimL family protein N-acetyltransferase
MASTLDVLAGTVTPKAAPDVKPHVRVIPYNAVHDTQADAFLPYIWQRMQQDDLVDYYFPGQKDTGFASFVRLFSGDGQVALLVTDDTSGQWNKTIAGFITWTPSIMGTSEVIIAGFIFFREFWDMHTTDEGGALAFQYWFTETQAKVVLGSCPSLHAAALRYNKRIGLRETGRIPSAHIYKGQSCDAVLMCITREEWEKRGQQ